MQIKQLGFVDFHVFDVVSKDFVGAFDVSVAYRELNVALSEIGATDDYVFMSSDQEDGRAARISTNRIEPEVECYKRSLFPALVIIDIFMQFQ